jgi:hypothetical protein
METRLFNESRHVFLPATVFPFVPLKDDEVGKVSPPDPCGQEQADHAEDECGFGVHVPSCSRFSRYSSNAMCAAASFIGHR